MKYPVAADEAITIIEQETSEKMEPVMKLLWTELVVPVANDAYRQGHDNTPLENLPDYLEYWKKEYSCDPSPDVVRFIKLLAKFQREIYRCGIHDASVEGNRP